MIGQHNKSKMKPSGSSAVLHTTASFENEEKIRISFLPGTR
jgi:hypothetical protein